MKRKRYDVVVVGCGPGGATAGKFAALHGADTLVIEQKRQIGFPVHDSMGIVYSKSEMEETTGERIEPEYIYSMVEGLRYISLSGKEGKLQSLPDGIFANRQLLEKSLAIGAARAGAEIMLHTRVVDVVKEARVVKGVTVKGVSGVTTIPCSVVIAADGSYQHIARLAGFQVPKAKISASLGCEFVGVKFLHKPGKVDEIYLGEANDGLYRYVAPYAPDRCSIGSGVGRDTIKQRSLKQRVDDLVTHLEKIGKYDFSKASPVNMMAGGTVAPVATAGRRLASDGIILVGDAAARPLFGCRWGVGGIFTACWTGRVAGEIAARAVRKGDITEGTLDKEYHCILDNSFKEGERESVLQAYSAWSTITFTLSPEEQERAMDEIGWEVAALHFYSKAGLASPLPSCLEPAQRWLKERRKVAAGGRISPQAMP